MLSRQLVEPPFEGLAKEEIFLVQRQNMVVLYGVKNPVGQGNFDILHPPVARFSYDFRRLNKAEDPEILLAALADVRFNLRALQPPECIFEQLVTLTRSLPVRRHEQIMRFESERPANRSTFVERGHALANAVNQHIAVMHRGQPEPGGRHFNEVLAILIPSGLHVWLCREGENRVFHRGHVALGDGIHDVTHEQVFLRMTVRQQRGA